MAPAEIPLRSEDIEPGPGTHQESTPLGGGMFFTTYHQDFDLGSPQPSVSPLPSSGTSLSGVAAYAGHLQEHLEANGFMSEVSHSVTLGRGVEVHVRMSERTRLKRFDKLLQVSSEKAARQVSAIAGLPQDWEQILERGPRDRKWPRTDWDWIACAEWDVWKQVFPHDRDYEKAIIRSRLSWKERWIVRIAKILDRIERKK